MWDESDIESVVYVLLMHHSTASDGLSDVYNVDIVPGCQKSITVFPRPYIVP